MCITDNTDASLGWVTIICIELEDSVMTVVQLGGKRLRYSSAELKTLSRKMLKASFNVADLLEMNYP